MKFKVLTTDVKVCMTWLHAILLIEFLSIFLMWALAGKLDFFCYSRTFELLTVLSKYFFNL